MNKIISIIALVCITLFATEVYAQAPKVKMEYGLTAGLNVGATTPIPKPSSVDKVYTWKPHMNFAFKGWTTIRFNRYQNWGLTSGLEFEKKGMYASTHVESIKINMNKYGYPGNTYTGDNSTDFSMSYLTLPVVATYITNNDRFRFHAGFYFSYLMENRFKVALDGDGVTDLGPFFPGQIADFDFSDQFNAWDFGGRVAVDFYFTPRIAVTGQVNMGITPILKRSFDAMPFSLHNVYSFVGFTYHLFK